MFVEADVVTETDPTGVISFLALVLGIALLRMGLFARDVSMRLLVTSIMSTDGAKALIAKMLSRRPTRNGRESVGRPSRASIYSVREEGRKSTADEPRGSQREKNLGPLAGVLPGRANRQSGQRSGSHASVAPAVQGIDLQGAGDRQSSGGRRVGARVERGPSQRSQKSQQSQKSPPLDRVLETTTPPWHMGMSRISKDGAVHPLPGSSGGRRSSLLARSHDQSISRPEASKPGKSGNSVNLESMHTVTLRRGAYQAGPASGREKEGERELSGGDRSQQPEWRPGNSRVSRFSMAERRERAPLLDERERLTNEFDLTLGLGQAARARESAIAQVTGMTRAELPEAMEIPRCNVVTVIFSDIVGFTTLSAKHPPSQMFGMLHEYFNKLDLLLPEFGVFKYQTVGDAYVAVVNFDGKSEGAEHAQVALEYARAMVRVAQSVLMPGDEGDERETWTGVPGGAPVEGGHEVHGAPRGMQIRVGVHSGPLAASVLGSERPALTLIGDTLNTGSRMESTSRPGHVRLSPSTFDLLPDSLKSTDAFQKEELDIKGKGLMDTYIIDCNDDDAWNRLIHGACAYKALESLHAAVPTQVRKARESDGSGLMQSRYRGIKPRPL